MTVETKTEIQVARENCQRFANAHKVVFEDHGEVGFCRPCVGFTKGTGYIDLHPLSKADYEELWPHDGRLNAPPGVNAYHKHDCLAVLVTYEGDESQQADYDRAILQLDAWVRDLESQGTVEVASYATGATGMQALLSGVIGYALRYTVNA